MRTVSVSAEMLRAFDPACTVERLFVGFSSKPESVHSRVLHEMLSMRFSNYIDWSCIKSSRIRFGQTMKIDFKVPHFQLRRTNQNRSHPLANHDNYLTILCCAIVAFTHNGAGCRSYCHFHLNNKKRKEKESFFSSTGNAWALWLNHNGTQPSNIWTTQFN